MFVLSNCSLRLRGGRTSTSACARRLGQLLCLGLAIIFLSLQSAEAQTGDVTLTQKNTRSVTPVDGTVITWDHPVTGANRCLVVTFSIHRLGGVDPMQPGQLATTMVSPSMTLAGPVRPSVRRLWMVGSADWARTYVKRALVQYARLGPGAFHDVVDVVGKHEAFGDQLVGGGLHRCEIGV